MTAPTRRPTQTRVAESMLAARDADAVHAWLARTAERSWMHVERVPLDALTGWLTEPGTGNLRHHTGRFFSVESLAVDLPGTPVPHWSQPIIDQPEIGILGVLVREIDGVLHCLMQAKHEPGNPNGLQLSPTVQATRSNYTRVHRGKPIPYLEHFRDTSAHRVLVDIRQSEQGAWFYRKRNRNMVVEVDGEVEVREGFRWFTLGEIAGLMTVPDLVNMDARTVLACLPGGGAALARAASDPFTEALVRSADPAAPGVHTIGDVLSWITEVRTRTDLRVTLGPLAGLPDWTREDGVIAHRDGRFFTVVGVDVRAGGREVGAWSQPMIEPVGTGVIAFLVKEIGGVLHVLTHARTEAGYADVTELAPTVQCVPETYDHLPTRPRFLDDVLTSSRVRFDAVLSEEGGRFLGARNRYLVVETDAEVAPDDPEYRWLTLHQYEELLRHSFYVNIQARSLLLCLRSLLPRG
ncbi:NDP-hexose 2,3-dehydratase [Saccharothrix sp. ALI-22-I]|uniref:NDP-hexose 2,3-dehydratase family protein n=1 Tax=Saccharothrix sp. ALI-22-I TaxID=1933778 RepID=UPI00097CA29A|nr:NDP-hexose 2,3-dehydratase family protein [Saccharothrix sp. ALI-22-I]ONI90748.1 NDP-hexose 2,3-dehydratase [Saccharothrix sp. ALI-22-I]